MEKKKLIFGLSALVVIILFAFLYYQVIWVAIYDPAPCGSFARNEMMEFMSNLEKTTKNRGDSNVFNFILPNGCLTSSEYEFRINKYDDSNFCASMCGLTQKTCFMLIYDQELIHEELCLNLPIYSTFNIYEEDCKKTGDGYSIADARYGLSYGEYFFENIASEEDTWPNICIYYKE